MSIREIVNILTSSGIEENEANAEVKLLIEKFCNLTAVDIVMGKKLDSNKLNIVRQKAEFRAKTRTPIQHIIGYGYFMGDKFEVNKDTLIPRDETEILVRKVIDIINKNNYKKALDIGTGTGCIACEIAKYTIAQVIGLDISSDTLQIALNNASAMNLHNKAIFRKSDIFSNVREDEKFDIIVSNPPYIPRSEKINIQKEVTFDPDLALYTNDEKGLEFYEKISKDAPKYLNEQGYLAFEIGMGQSEDVKNILIKNGFKNIDVEKDLAGIDRVIIGQI